MKRFEKVEMTATQRTRCMTKMTITTAGLLLSQQFDDNMVILSTVLVLTIIGGFSVAQVRNR